MLAEESVRIKADTSGFHQSVSGGVLSSVTKVAGAATAIFGGVKLAKGLFVDPIKSAGDFEQTLNVLQATAKSGGATLGQVQQKAMDLGADLKLPATSANDAAKAMLELGRGGFTMKESMTAAHGVLLLSAAAQIDNATAATYTADALHAFGMQAKDSNKVVDDFAGAANASTASMGEVAQALQQSGQGFHQLGVPIGEASTAIAEMANAGIKGSDAGTSLKTMLQRLNPTTKQAKAEMADMGVKTFDAHGKFVGMRSVIEQMGPKLRAMTQEQRQQALTTIFGSDASRAAGIILTQTAQHWDNMRDKVTKAGQAQKLADAQSKGFNGAMAGLRSTIETLQLQIGLKLLPVITTLVRFLSGNLPAAAKAVGSAFGAFADIIRSVADWLGVFQEKAANDHGLNGLSNGLDTTRTRFETFMGVVRTVAGVIGSAFSAAAGFVSAHMDTIRSVVSTTVSVLSSAWGGVVTAVQGVITVVSDLVNWMNQNRDVAMALAGFVATLAAGFLLYQTTMLAVRGALAIATAAQWLLNAAMTANPIGILVVAIAALVAGLILLYQRSETARNIMNAAWAAIKAGAQAAFDYIRNVIIPGAIAAWQRFGPEVVGFLTDAANRIRTVVQTIATIVNGIVDTIRDHWDDIWSVFGPIVVAALQVARTATQTVLNVIAGVVRLFAALLRGDWSGAWNALKGIVSDVLAGVVSIVGSVLRGLAGTALALAKIIGRQIAAGIKAVVGYLTGLAGDISGKVQSAVGQVAGSAVTWARSVGFAIADGILSGIGNLGSRLAGKLIGAADSAKNSVMSHLGINSPSKVFADTVGLGIGEGIEVGMTSSTAILGPKLSAQLNQLATIASTVTKSNAGKVGDAFKSWVDNAKAKFDSGIANMQTKLQADLAKGQAAIERAKAQATPAEMVQAANQARAELAKVQADVTAAAAALNTLPAKQAAAWSQLLAQQKQNMDALKATLQQNTDDALLAGHTFNKGMEAAAGNPFATSLTGAQQHFNQIKGEFDRGLTDQATFLAAADALENQKLAAQKAIDDASAAGTEATEAQKLAATQAAQAQTLLDQYNTYTTALDQQTAAGSAITTQTQTDADARKAVEDQNHVDMLAAKETYEGTIAARDEFFLGQAATRERTARDAAAAALNTSLVARYNRIDEHLDNVRKNTDAHFDELARMATKSGGSIAANLAQAMRDSLPLVTSAASALANEVRKFLKTASPTEAGPMSDLDTWWKGLAPALVGSLDGSAIKAALSNAVTPSSGGFPGASRQLGPNPGISQRPTVSTQRMEYLLERISKTLDKQTPASQVTEIHPPGSVGIDASVYRSRR